MWILEAERESFREGRICSQVTWGGLMGVLIRLEDLNPGKAPLCWAVVGARDGIYRPVRSSGEGIPDPKLPLEGFV